MKQKNCLTLDNGFLEYCKLNNIVDVEKKAAEIFNIGQQPVLPREIKYTKV